MKLGGVEEEGGENVTWSGLLEAGVREGRGGGRIRGERERRGESIACNGIEILHVNTQSCI